MEKWILLLKVFVHLKLLNFNSKQELEFNNFKSNCIDWAMFHDLDETLILRDLSHLFKYNTFNGEEIRKYTVETTQANVGIA